MSFDWKPEYSVGVKEIDNQHNELISIISKLNQAINSLNTKEEISLILEKLIEFTGSHFSTEEKYFDQFNYENSETHKKEHKKFKEKIMFFNNKFKGNEMEISFELIDFLEDWLLEHLIEEDQKYVKCFAEHGLS